VRELAPYTYEDAQQAVLKGNLTSIDTILSELQLSNDQSLLLYALIENREEVALHLIQNYSAVMDFQRPNEKGDSPLMVAIFRKMSRLIAPLMPLSDPNARDRHNNTAFIAAAANGDMSALMMLCNDPRTDVLARNCEGQSALHRACYFGELKAVELLFGRGLKAGEKDRKGNNAVHLACMGVSLVVSRYLMRKVKNSSVLLVENKEGKRPLDLLMESVKLVGGRQVEDFKIEHLRHGPAAT
jgi:uncharacterized protein